MKIAAEFIKYSIAGFAAIALAAAFSAARVSIGSLPPAIDWRAAVPLMPASAMLTSG
jgi:hypothetical protein